MANEKIEPIIIENPDTGVKYTIEYSRATSKRLERETGVNIFQLQDLLKKAPMDTMSNLFYYGFLMHHEGEIDQEETDDILFNGMGVDEELIEKLVTLYAQAYASMRVDSKNPKWVVKK